MTTERLPLTSFGFCWPELTAFRSWIEKRRTNAAVANLDDRLRRDIGLDPIGRDTVSPTVAAARISLMACR